VRLLLSLLVLASASFAKPRVVDVAVVLDGPWSRNEQVFSVFEREILALTKGEFEVRFPETLRFEADWSGPGVEAALQRALVAPEVDLVLALGVLGSHFAGHASALPKPVVAPFVIDAQMQQFPAEGRANLAYLTGRLDFARELRVFGEVVRYRKLVCLGNRHFLEAVPQLAAGVGAVLVGQQAEVVLVSVGDDLQAALERIPADADAVYVAPLLHLKDTDFERLVAYLTERELPSFSVMGRDEVERGLLLGLRPTSDVPRLARRVALATQQILLGEPARAQPSVFDTHEQLTINMATARAVGAWPSWRILTEAVLLHTERSDTDRELTLATAVREGLSVSADLAVADAEVAAGAENVPRARSRLLPALDVSARATMIDDDRAAASFGSQAEWSGAVQASLTQVLWAEGAWADLAAQGALQRGRVHGREARRLDVALETANAFLSVLQARTFERIQRDNLKLTRSHLEAARVRERIGSGNASEVHRWEAQIATDTQAVIDAEVQHKVARIALNRILRRPLEEPFIAREVALSDSEMVTSNEGVFELLDNPHTFAVFRSFMVQEGLRAAPELAQLDATIAAAERRVASTQRALWSPTLALQGQLGYRVFEAGEGTEGLDLPIPDPPATADDLDYSVSVKASLPLYAGGGRYAEIRQARGEVLTLRRQRAAVAEGIEQRIRAAVHASGASFPSIRLSGEAAAAARKNLALVSEAYARGAVNIIQLTDAQNAARTAELLEANAVYRFTADLMRVHRAVGEFYFLATPLDRAAWMARFVAHMAARR